MFGIFRNGDSTQAKDHARAARQESSKAGARAARSARSGNIVGATVKVTGRHAAQSKGARRAL